MKSFDRSILHNLYNENSEVKKIDLWEKNNDNDENDDNEQNDVSSFMDRIAKIEKQGLLRNRYYFEYQSDSDEYKKAKMMFYKEISLASGDNLITHTGIQNCYCVNLH